MTLTSGKTTLTLGYSDPITDTFGAHPLLGATLDLNDGATFTLVSPDGLELSAPEKTLVPAGNIRTQGERAIRAIYRRNRTAVVRLIFGPAATYAAWAASIRSLVRWLDAPPATPITLRWQPPSATSAVYLDVVGAAHGIPADEREWLRLQAEPIEIVFLVRPGLRGDRVTLSNLLVNPGFEAGSGPAVSVFNDTFATLNAYSVQAGAALTQDKSYYTGAVMADAPLRYYRLDESSGTVVYDASSSGVNGAVIAGTTQGVTGLLTGDADTCYTFAAASSQYASAGSSGLPTAANAPVTLEAWFKFASNPATSQFIACLGDRASSTHFLALVLSTTGYVQASTGTVVINSSSLSTGVAHHLVAEYDGTTLHLYVDGAQVGTGSAASLTLAYVGSQPFTIAASSSGTGPISPAAFFSGQVDEVAVYGSALSGARIAAHYTAGTTSPATEANTALLASGNRVSFGSPSWSAINQWQMRLRYFSGATATFYLHYTDASNYLACVLSPSALTLNHAVGGSVHQLATTALTPVNGLRYWLRLTQFPTVSDGPAAVQAQLFYDAAGAVGSQFGSTVGPIATYDAVTALSGAPQIAAFGASLGLGGPYSGVHTLSLFGPGGWTYTPLLGAATAAASGAWELAPTSTYPNGAVTSYGAARCDFPSAGSVDAAWESYSGGAPAGSSAIPAVTGQSVAAMAHVKSSGLSVTATISLRLREWDASGTLLRSTALQSVTGNQASWVALSGSVASLGATTAYVSLMLEIADATVGASAGASVWLDNAQVWNVTTSGVAAGAMPYCELRFAQSPAQLLVTGLLGDLPAPALLAWGTYLASWPTGSTLSYALGRRALASPNARMVAPSIGYYGAALLPTSTPTLDATAFGGYYISASVNPGWNPRAFSFAPRDLLGVFHLFTRFWTAQLLANLANISVRVDAVQASGPWFASALDGTLQLGEYDGSYAYPLSASSTWTTLDAGQFAVPILPVGALTDLSASYLTPRSQWTDATGGGSTCRSDWQALLPTDGSLVVGLVNNPSNAVFALTQQWLWAYHDALLVNRAGAGDSAATMYSIETEPLPAPSRGAGGPGTATTGVININSGADPYLTLDPTVGCAAINDGVTAAAGGNGVNQFAGYVSDNNGAVLPLHAELQYSPLYLYPR